MRLSILTESLSLSAPSNKKTTKRRKTPSVRRTQNTIVKRLTSKALTRRLQILLTSLSFWKFTVQSSQRIVSSWGLGTSIVPIRYVQIFYPSSFYVNLAPAMGICKVILVDFTAALTAYPTRLTCKEGSVNLVPLDCFSYYCHILWDLHSSTERKESWRRGREKVYTSMKSFRLEMGFEPTTYLCTYS